ncbi:zinc finger and BTB domain-containing protein 17-like [Penaeus japonicus]|uniref:zinc finger and BTB domain-containing protein 17-like n=1 Tax=Penaeus japonicus TaxID=27405 RepID=UPI001C7113C5|nr:zinc finger and BTB domain-containing protein 17-like [Penaeus japonicus]XP_042864722.1 zinc finger and BTB domain-containing protein 17-like [Penaeus japonicus]
MHSIGVQADLEEPKSGGPYIFICVIKNEDAGTQCYLPCTSDAATSMHDVYAESCSIRISESDSSEKGQAFKCQPRKRGRPKKHKKPPTNSSLVDDGDSEDIMGILKVLSASRSKRERKVPVKFDPSDINKTKVTSHPVSHMNATLGFDEREIDWKIEDTEEEGRSAVKSHEKGNLLMDNCPSSQYSTEENTEEPVEVGDNMTSQDDQEIAEERMGLMANPLGKKRRLDGYRGSRGSYRKRKGPYRCDHCKLNFKLHSIFTKHMQSHKSTLDSHSFPCKLCGKLLSSSVNLKRHMLIHSGKPFTCEECGKSYTGRYLLREHMILEHGRTLPDSQTPSDYQCQACMRYMSSKTTLEYHLAVMQTCPHCETTWPCKKSLRDHILKIHDEAKVTKEGCLVCELCNKTFIYRNRYLNHIAQHSSEKKFECTKCNKSLSTYQALYCHKKQVHEKHNYRHPCSMCDKVFICKSKLVEHIRTHTGEKPFACNECNVAFAAKATYKTHMKLIHRSKTPNQKLGKKTLKTDLQYKYNCPICHIELKSDQLETHFSNVHIATVQFSNSLPADLSDKNRVVVDRTKGIVLLQGEPHSPVVEGSKEIVLSEGSTGIIVLEGTSQSLAKDECSEVMVTL